MAESKNLNGWFRPVDLARRHGLSTQAVRNYEAEGILPPAHRTTSGHRRYASAHRLALDAFVCLTMAAGRQPAARIVASLTAGDPAAALEGLEELHVELSRDRATVRQIEHAIRGLPDLGHQSGPPLTSTELARRITVTTTTLRHWEQLGILNPQQEAGHRRYRALDVRDAELARLMRRGGSNLSTIAAVIHALRAQGDMTQLRDAVAGWQADIDRRAVGLLEASVALDAYRRAGG